MPSEKPKIVIRTEQDIINKLDEIAAEQGRSRSNMAEQIIISYIKQHEEQNKKAEDKAKHNLLATKIG